MIKKENEVVESTEEVVKTTEVKETPVEETVETTDEVVKTRSNSGIDIN